MKNFIKQNLTYAFLTATNIFRKVKWIKDSVNALRRDKNLEIVLSVHQFYKHIWHEKNKKLQKVLPWMNSYTSRQTAPKLYREDTGIASATRSNFWRNEKESEKK